MDHIPFLQSELFKWVVLPALIFCARVCDVSLDTLRILFISRGKKFLAPILGFVQVIIWLLAIGQIMKNLSNPACYIAYGGGFALGTFLGIIIEEKLSMGMLVLRIITRKNAGDLIEVLRKQDYGVTTIDAQGKTGPVSLIFMIIKRKDMKDVVELINKYHPNAFYSVDDLKLVESGVFPQRSAPAGFTRLLNPSPDR